MKLFIILIALGLERYLPIGSALHRFNWFSAYVGLLQSVIKVKAVWQGWLGIAVVLLPLLIVLAILCLIFSYLFYGAGSAILSFAVLLYCFGPADLFQEMNAYFAAHDKNDQAAQNKPAQTLATWGGMDDPEDPDKSLVSTIFLATHEGLISVLFWFVILGPFGALLYRTTVLLDQLARRESDYESMAGPVRTLQNVLEWLPARLAGLIFALVGHFNEGMKAWLKHVWQDLLSSRDLVINCGLVSIGLKSSKAKPVTSARDALNLVERTLIVMLVLVVIFTLGAWIS